MAKTLFYVHVPKCAGMSLTNALKRDLSADRLYQSTSMIENFRTGRPDFLEIRDHRRLRAVVGHWLHEAMLPYLSEDLLFATSIRNPLDRVRSQFRFDMTKRASGWRPPSTENFLARNRNVICGFLTSVFPSVRAAHPTALDACKTILSGMDVVFDVPDALANQRSLMCEIGIAEPSVQRENRTENVGVEIEVSDQQILPFVDEDMSLYTWFKDRQAAGQGTPTNPVFDADSRACLGRLHEAERQPEVLAKHLALRLARELKVEAEAPVAMETWLWRRQLFATKLYTAYREARKG